MSSSAPPGTTPQAATGVALTGPDDLGRYRYGGWTISYDPPPIPVRSCDWQFSHDDFDAEWLGEEDGWSGNGLSGYAPSLAEAITEIDAIEEDRA